MLVRHSSAAALCRLLYDRTPLASEIAPLLSVQVVSVTPYTYLDAKAVVIETPTASIVVFRGTEFSDKQSAMRNDPRLLVPGPAGNVLKGYREAAEQLSRQFALTKKPLHVFGHSQGGGIAAIYSAFIATNKHTGRYLLLRQLTTFGSPRAGDAEFGRLIQSLEIDGDIEVTRYTTTSDPIPWLPLRRRGYDHVIAEHYLDRNANVIRSPWTAYRLWDGLLNRINTGDWAQWRESHDSENYHAKLLQAGL